MLQWSLFPRFFLENTSHRPQVKWVGYSVAECTWEPEWEIPEDVVQQFEALQVQSDPGSALVHQKTEDELSEFSISSTEICIGSTDQRDCSLCLPLGLIYTTILVWPFSTGVDRSDMHDCLRKCSLRKCYNLELTSGEVRL
jgi:hypothetical protein